MFPQINTNDIKPWAGLRPMTPNMLPIVRKSENNPIKYGITQDMDILVGH